MKQLIRGITKSIMGYGRRDILFSREYYNYDLVSKESRKNEDLERVLLTGLKVLDEIGVNYWVGRGTLLGLHRDNKFLPMDIDLDIDVFSDTFVFDIIKKMPFDVLLSTTFRGKYMQMTFIDNETQILFDIWFYHEDKDRFTHRNYFGTFWIPAENISQLHHIKYNGNDFMIPDPDWYCDFWYGKDWKTPKSYKGHWTESYKNDCKGFIFTGYKNTEAINLY